MQKLLYCKQFDRNCIVNQAYAMILIDFFVELFMVNQLALIECVVTNKSEETRMFVTT